MKRKFKTKFVSALLTVCLLFSTFGISANASAFAVGIGAGGIAKAAGGALLGGWAAYEIGQRIEGIYNFGRNAYNNITQEVYSWKGQFQNAVSGGSYTPDINYPGDDPSVSPGEDWEWRGPSDKGGWYNPKTGESLHPDLDHPDPQGPHWDYIPYKNGPQYRINPDGGVYPK